MKILMVMPLPPPVTGQSHAARGLRDDLERRDGVVVEVVDMAKNSFRDGFGSCGRLLEVGRMLMRVLRRSRDAEVLYLTVSESIAGNLKDLVLYVLWSGRLGRVVVHVHGGSLRTQIFDRHRFLRGLNRFFLSRVAGAIVLGESHRNMLAGMIPEDRLFVVPNFVEPEGFLDPVEIRAKFASGPPLQVLFLSNLIPGKGHEDLLEALLSLPDSLRGKVMLHFAGAFESPASERDFLGRCAGRPDVQYHGLVSGQVKRGLLASSHLLCLPTRLLEGQPLAILEGYAAGCAVVTTLQGGIPDIFADGVNGFSIRPGSPASIQAVLARCVGQFPQLRSMGLANHAQARDRFTVDLHGARMLDIFRKTAAGPRGRA